MKDLYKLTYISLALVILVGTAIAFSKTPGTQPAAAAQNQDQAKWKAREEEKKKHFPTAEFDEAELTDPLKREQRKQKQKRKNGLGLVSLNPEPSMGGGLFLPQNQFDFPGLPVEQSPVIVIGDVLKSEAHLSEDKRGVYSEFTIRLVEVIKADASLPASEMIVERLGGYVRYPNGRTLLYRFGTGGMPRLEARYLFFLKPTPELDYSILTAYEFGDKGVVALDPSAQFEKYDGYASDALRRLVVEAVRKSGKHQGPFMRAVRSLSREIRVKNCLHDRPHDKTEWHRDNHHYERPGPRTSCRLIIRIADVQSAKLHLPANQQNNHDNKHNVEARRNKRDKRNQAED